MYLDWLRNLYSWYSCRVVSNERSPSGLIAIIVSNYCQSSSDIQVSVFLRSYIVLVLLISSVLHCSFSSNAPNNCLHAPPAGNETKKPSRTSMRAVNTVTFLTRENENGQIDNVLDVDGRIPECTVSDL